MERERWRDGEREREIQTWRQTERYGGGQCKLLITWSVSGDVPPSETTPWYCSTASSSFLPAETWRQARGVRERGRGGQEEEAAAEEDEEDEEAGGGG